MATHRAHHGHGLPHLFLRIWAPIPVLRRLGARRIRRLRSKGPPTSRRSSTPPCIYIVVRVSVATLEMSERSGNPSTLTQVTRTKPTSEKKKRDHQSSVCTEVVEEIKSGSRPLWQYCLASSPVVRRRASQKQKRIVFECCFEGANTR